VLLFKLLIILIVSAVKWFVLSTIKDVITAFTFIATIVGFVDNVLSLMERWKRRKKKNHD
jgi:hypothetical protein